MRFDQLIEVVGEEPVFEPALLLAGDVDPADVQRQISRWSRRDALISSGAASMPWLPRTRRWCLISCRDSIGSGSPATCVLSSRARPRWTC
jgi:hypothetical protein